MITVFGMQSPFVYRVRASLLAKGLEFEHVSVNLAAPSAEFLAISPFAKIPVLRDGDLTIADSHSILDYLDSKYPGYAFLGATAADRARILAIVAEADAIMMNIRPLSTVGFGVFEKRGAEEMARRGVLGADEMEAAAIREGARRSFDRLAGLLAGDFFAGNQFSAADAAVLTSAMIAAKFAGAELGALQPYFDRCMADPQIARMVTPADEPAAGEI